MNLLQWFFSLFKNITDHGGGWLLGQYCWAKFCYDTDGGHGRPSL